MIKQTLFFSNPAFLSLKNRQLVIDTKSERGTVTRPIEDIGVVVIESHCVTFTSALLSALLDNNAAILFCDSKHMPSGLLTPLSGNTLMNERSRDQLAASLPLKKQLWQQTVSSKIANQGKLLALSSACETGCMSQWAKMVKSGDPDNLEARAAIYYWKNLFTDKPGFLRHDEEEVLNSLLDYGYAILRAVMARAIVGAGLIPNVGLFHSNKYNSYCLADDLMEPYRPYVDRLVVSIHKAHPEIAVLTPEIKRLLLSIPIIDVRIGKVKRPLMIAAGITAASLTKCFSGEIRKISYPEI